MRKRYLGFIALGLLFGLTSCGEADAIKGETGPKGDTGNGIVTILKTNTEGLVDTYTIVFSDGTTTTFEVKNGSQGIQGNNGENGKTPVITIGENGNWYIDGIDTTKPSNIKGETGNGILKIEKTSTNDLVDTYTITFTDGATTTFDVTNGNTASAATEENKEKYEVVDIRNVYDDVYKDVKTFDTVSNEFQKLTYIYLQGEWIPRRKEVTKRDSHDKRTFVAAYKYVDGDWEIEDASKTISEYDDNDNIVLSETYYWNSTLNDWVFDGKDEYSYYSNNKKKTEINIRNSHLESIGWSKLTILYDENELKVSETTCRSLSETGPWKNYSMTKYYRDDVSTMIESYDWDDELNDWKPKNMTKYIYEDGNSIKTEHYRWDEELNDWEID